MNAPREHLHQAELLLRLRALRRQQAERARQTAQQAQAQALQAVRDGQGRLHAERQAHAALLQAMAREPALPRLAAFAEARRAQVEEQQERAEYALLDDEEALERADHDLTQAARALARAHAREQAATQAADAARRRLRLATEQRLEREDTPCTRPSGGHR
jgi:hypothetical protein